MNHPWKLGNPLLRTYAHFVRRVEEDLHSYVRSFVRSFLPSFLPSAEERCSRCTLTATRGLIVETPDTPPATRGQLPFEDFAGVNPPPKQKVKLPTLRKWIVAKGAFKAST